MFESFQTALRKPEASLMLVRYLALVGILISTLETLWNWRHYRRGGLYDWRVMRSRIEVGGSTLLSGIAGGMLGFRGYLVVLTTRVIAILALLLATNLRVVDVVGLTVVLITTLLINLRSPVGQDGSDQMATIIFASLWINLFSSIDPRITVVCLWFIALQSCTSYCVSGIAKAFGKTWRNGEAVFRIFNTETYGLEPAAGFLQAHPSISAAVTRSTILVESAFPLVLILPWPFIVLFLAWGFGFHLMNAVVMGLNSFFWSFVATYPAILYCAFSWRS